MHTVDDALGNMERLIQKELNADMTPIVYPVHASADGTGNIIDAAGHVLGTVEIVAELNRLAAADCSLSPDPATQRQSIAPSQFDPHQSVGAQTQPWPLFT